MSDGHLATIVARTYTLVTNWTAARAAKVDNLDATVTSRAAASTALSSATWTGARAAKLDNLDGLISDAKKNLVHKFQLVTSNTTWNKPAAFAGTILWITGIAGGGGAPRTGGATAGSWGGGSGEYICRRQLEVGASLAITIGAGGAGAGTANASNGGNTVIGAWTLTGGKGGYRDTTQFNAQVGAPPGYLDENPSAPYILPAGAPACAFGGSPGIGFGAGAGGLVLDQTNAKGGDGSGSGSSALYGGGGIGYGAGGGVGQLSDGGDGAPGAVLLEWFEWEAAP